MYLECVRALTTYQTLNGDKKLLKALRRRLRQQSQIISEEQNQLSHNVKITCLNSSDLTWEIALNNLVEMQNGNLSSLLGNCNLNLNELMHIEKLLEDTSVLPFE